MLRMLTGCFKYLFSSDIRRACRIAKSTFNIDHPELIWEGSSVRASEKERFVIAVFYQHPDYMTRPSLYKLYSVSRDLKDSEELQSNQGSPYRIKGRR